MGWNIGWKRNHGSVVKFSFIFIEYNMKKINYCLGWLYSEVYFYFHALLWLSFPHTSFSITLLNVWHLFCGYYSEEPTEPYTYVDFDLPKKEANPVKPEE